MLLFLLCIDIISYANLIHEVNLMENCFEKTHMNDFVLGQLYLFYWAYNPLSDVISEIGPGQIALLISIDQSKEKRISPSIAAIKHKVGRSRIANAGRDLEKKGYLSEIADQVDKRKKYFLLTTKGEETCRLIQEDYQRFRNEMERKIGYDKFQALLQQLETLVDESDSYFIQRRKKNA